MMLERLEIKRQRKYCMRASSVRKEQANVHGNTSMQPTKKASKDKN